MGAASGYSALPQCVAVFPGDAGVRRIAESDHNIVHGSEYDRGATSSPWKPDLLIQDIRAFRTLR